MANNKSAIKFILLFGIVSLFADMTYEGARSITGPFLALLGASATAVGFVAGFGELIGYALRLVSGYLSDKTQRYWAITIAGYAINLFAVPLLALCNRWELAAVLIVMERAGKALRVPARDAMLSHATRKVGHGWGFGLHEAVDQIGALLGPCIVATILAFQKNYAAGFAILLIPAILSFSVLLAARGLYPHPHHSTATVPIPAARGFPRAYWIYLAGTACIAVGYADFPLVAYHFKSTSLMPDTWIPILYAIAMGVDALAALLFGKLFDKHGVRILAIASGIALFFAPLVFLGGMRSAVAGMILWGIGMGAQESLLKAAVAEMIPAERRGSAFGLFHTGFGIAWFIGSAAMGIIYDVSLVAVVAFSMLAQALSIPLLLSVKSLPFVRGGQVG